MNLRPRHLVWGIVAAVPLAFLAVFFAWPVLTMAIRGFLPEGVVDLTGAGDVFTRSRTWRIIGLTLAQAGVGTAISVLLGIPGAYVLYRRHFRGVHLLRGLVTVPFVLPTVVVGLAFRALFVTGGPLEFLGIDGTFTAIVIALVFFNYAVVVRTVGGMWARLDPRATEAARSLDATSWRAFRTVTLPALTPAITSAAAVVFLFCATAFGVVMTMGNIRYGTIETEIWMQTTRFLDLRAAAVLSVTQAVVVTLALALAARTRRRAERALELRTDEAHRQPLRLILRPGSGHRWRLGPDLVPAVITALTVTLAVVPLAHLLLRSLRTPRGWGWDNYVNLGTTGGANALTVTVWEATANSLRIALVATLIAVTIGVAVALVVSRRPRQRVAQRALSVVDGLFMLPLGVSAVTVGFGFFITLDRPPVDLRTSWIIVPIAQAVVAVPLVVRTVLPVLRAIDPRLKEVAAVLGAAPGRVLRTVEGPYLLRSLGLATGFAFAVSLGEFGATSFLARPDRPTLPVVIFRLIGRPGAENYGMALAAAVILAALTATIMIVAERLHTDRVTQW